MSGSVKILLVEDDDLFRATIKRALLKRSFEVFEAPNGKAAKEMMMLQTFDLVISDIQMPHFSGIELLEWIKKNAPTPVVLMTGFSQTLETKKADQMGADGFLAKPFKEADLQEVIAQFTEKNGTAPITEVNLQKQFCKVTVDEFISEKETEVDIYLRLSDTKFVKIAHKGGKISEDRIRAYKEKGVDFVHIKKEDFPKIVKFNLKVAKVAKLSTEINLVKKVAFMKHAGELILENAFVNGIDVNSFRESKDFLETSMGVLAEDEQLFTILDVLSSHTDFLYAHSLGVSSFSVMIGRELGWTSAPTLFKLAMGGLFHDIGKKEIEKELLEKPRSLLNQKERSFIESHPTRGKEILESLGNIPSEVVAIAYQHHEDIIGQGFPRGLSKNEIHPLAKVVQVANIFCEYAVKCRPDVTPMTGSEAILSMECHYSDILDKEAFKALKRLFK